MGAALIFFFTFAYLEEERGSRNRREDSVKLQECGGEGEEEGGEGLVSQEEEVSGRPNCTQLAVTVGRTKLLNLTLDYNKMFTD